MLALIQEHTRKIYDLENKTFEVQHIKARELLVPQRFDLFAKLFYIANRDDKPKEALQVYVDHIKAFNPDGKEPGREDKNSVEDFVKVFDELIDQFKNTDFDENISIIPVDKDGVILDGAHRVAALAFYDKVATIARFKDVIAKSPFDYRYFKKRGMSWANLDIIALEMMKWLPNTHVMCLWPNLKRIEKEKAVSIIREKHPVAYHKNVKTTLDSLTSFVKSIYSNQEWTKSKIAVRDKAVRCYGSGSSLDLVFFSSSLSLDELLNEKEMLRQVFGNGKDSLHITDNATETNDIASITLDTDELSNWNAAEAGTVKRISRIISERIYYFKKVSWINLKVKIAHFIRR